MNLVYHSTRNSEETATASEAILKGLTSDGGLFVPDSIPKLNVALEDLTKMSYQEIAYAVMKEFLTDFTEEELKENHSKMPHGGFVIRTGETGCEGNKHVIEYSLKLDSNPEFTGSVLVAYARAAHRLSKKGESGARSVFDIAPAMLSQMTPEELRAHML